MGVHTRSSKVRWCHLASATWKVPPGERHVARARRTRVVALCCGEWCMPCEQIVAQMWHCSVLVTYVLEQEGIAARSRRHVARTFACAGWRGDRRAPAELASRILRQRGRHRRLGRHPRCARSVPGARKQHTQIQRLSACALQRTRLAMQICLSGGGPAGRLAAATSAPGFGSPLPQSAKACLQVQQVMRDFYACRFAAPLSMLDERSPKSAAGAARALHAGHAS